jgi:hypothetical protein
VAVKLGAQLLRPLLGAGVAHTEEGEQAASICSKRQPRSRSRPP